MTISALNPPFGLRSTIAACLPGHLINPTCVDAVPAAAGAYLLLLQLGKSARFRKRGAPDQLIPAGWYVYAGSAHGPGGIRARLRRHFRSDKRQHWHIDQLTTQPYAQMWACAGAGYQECDLVSHLNDSGVFRAPCPGFGSTDCNKCDSHLLRWTP